MSLEFVWRAQIFGLEALCQAFMSRVVQLEPVNESVVDGTTEQPSGLTWK